jgi:hypothetical protein
VRVRYWTRRWAPGGDHCAPHCAHLRPPEIRWLITLLQPEQGIDSGTVVACWAAMIFSGCSFQQSISPYTSRVELFLNQSNA